MTAPLLSVDGLSVKVDDGTVLLDSVKLRLEAGQLLVVRGPSGAGKSIMLRAIVELAPVAREPTSGGSVSLLGRNAAEMPPAEMRATIVYVPQTPPRLAGTVRENLEAVRKLAATRARVAPWDVVVAWMERFGVLDRLPRPMDELSGGEAQRVGLVRALQLNPSVLLLDEPTSALDAETATRILQVVRDWTRAAPERGVVLVAHDIAQVQPFADAWLRVEAGRASAAAAPESA